MARLRQLAASPQTPAAVARRARIVLAAAGRPMRTAADRPVSRATAARWMHRFEAAGVAGLQGSEAFLFAWIENAMLVPLGIVACHSRKRPVGSSPCAHAESYSRFSAC